MKSITGTHPINQFSTNRFAFKLKWVYVAPLMILVWVQWRVSSLSCLHEPDTPFSMYGRSYEFNVIFFFKRDYGTIRINWRDLIRRDGFNLFIKSSCLFRKPGAWLVNMVQLGNFIQRPPLFTQKKNVVQIPKRCYIIYFI